MISNGVESFELFPEPSLLAPPKAPPRLPGANLKTTEALLDILKDNHEKWHIFYDDQGRHNHSMHHILALWTLGAHQDLLHGSYRVNIPLQRPKPEITEAITSSNFNDHLGDATYYSAYLAFFDDVVREHKGDPGSLMEQYIYSTKANFGSTSQKGEHPQMACRFLEFVIHPMIHFGYGVEFGLPVMLSEGLAQTAVHPVRFAPLISESLFTSVLSAPNETQPGGPTVHAFTVVARILADPRFKIPGTTFIEVITQLFIKHSAALTEHVNQWTVDVKKLATDPKEIDRKIEELQWTNTILYAVSGYTHLKEDKLSCFGTYFTVSLTCWIANGRPTLDISAFMSPRPAPHPGALSSSSTIATNSNPWLYIVQQASVHPDAHLPKIVRSLSHFALLYGQRKADEMDFAQTELKGAEMLDGTLFVRAAALTARRLENIEADEHLVHWDRPGFFNSASDDATNKLSIGGMFE
ncbi:hypothetical protein BT96DRAFT_918658 [Gymnopus androsaceus JB14]|uniref:Uncharacterized protein n=1 Tax=Gymnopus androsaceus JB14 TaxID=1447944 RepID=A0A6A4HV53_9AGAR|nr:hypothetical protein BT96DRAFT_918658 [Gymnopus androsaceus JB14]